MALCWKCRELIEEKYPKLIAHEFIHCHHNEPEEKPREICWCKMHEDNKTFNVTKISYPQGIWVHIKRNFCPECGMKL